MNSFIKLPYGHPLKDLARSIAHHATWGVVDVVAVSDSALARHLLAICMIEWCEQEGWTCNEIEPGQFSMREGTQLKICAPGHEGQGEIKLFRVPDLSKLFQTQD